MPLTASSEFIQCTLNFDENNSLPRNVVFTTSDNTYGWVEISPKGPSELIESVAGDFGILQDIWESHGSDFPGVGAATIDLDFWVAAHWGASTLDELEEFESYNPFDDGSYARYERKRLFNTAIVQDSAITEDAMTGKKSIVAQFDIKTERRTPSGATFAYSTQDWLASASYGDNFDIRVYFNGSDGVRADSAENNLNDQAEIRAILGWLNIIKRSSDAIVTSVQSLTGRNYSVTFPGETEPFIFQTSGLRIFAYNSDNHVTRIQLIFDPITANTVDFSGAGLNSILQTTSIDIPTVANIQVSDFGSHDIPTRASEIDFGDGQKIKLNNGAPVFQGKDPETEEVYVVPLTGFSGRVKRVDRLATETGTTKKIIDPTATTVVYEGNSNVVVKFPPPSELMLSSGTDKIFTVQYTPPPGTGDDGSVELQDWDDDNIITLRKGQLCRMQAMVDEDGNGRLVGFDLPPRRFSNIGESFDLGILGTLVVLTSTANSSQRFREIDSNDVASRIYIDDDAFEQGVDIIAYNSSIQAITDWNFNNTLRFKKPGRVEYELRMGIRFDSNASGSLSAYHGPLLFRQRDEDSSDPDFVEGSTDLVTLIGFRADEHAGANTEYDYTIAWNNGRVQAQDWIVPLFRYFTSSTVDLSDLHYQNVSLNATLFQEYTKVEA